MQIPTTPGTGSEAGTRALVTDPVSRNKQAVQSRFMLADIAIVDPDLTMTVPKEVTAATGVDALAHCVEAYTSRKAHPLIDLYAIAGARLVGQFLKRAVADGGDREARAAFDPQVPAVAEFLPGFEAVAWHGFFVPAATPKPIVEKLSAEIRAFTQQPDTVQKMAELGAVAVAVDSEPFAACIVSETERWKKVIEAANIKLE